MFESHLILNGKYYSRYITATMYAYDYLFKVLLVGSSGIGKTATLYRFTLDEFDPIKFSSDLRQSLKKCESKYNNFVSFTTFSVTLHQQVISKSNQSNWMESILKYKHGRQYYRSFS